MNVWMFFYDPVLRGPVIASMLMCCVAALAGVIAYLRKQSLLGEALSHASYPGVALAVATVGLLGGGVDSPFLTAAILVGAVLSALLAHFLIHILQTRLSVPGDAALCFVLASSFGIGTTLASRLQFSHTTLYQQVQLYLYGQVATMSDLHIFIYGLQAAIFVLVIFIFYKELQVITLDRNYAKSLGLSVKKIDFFFFFLIAISVVIGIRSVGVVLMAAMLIAPAVAARQFTNRLSIMFLIAALVGMLSGWFGNVLSFALPSLQSLEGVSFPIGPMIVLVASFLCFLSLLFAPQRGLFLRFIRASLFRFKCIRENILKTIWHHGPKKEIAVSEIAKYQKINRVYLWWILRHLASQGWIKQSGKQYQLTTAGVRRGAQIVRLHRLWEVYLADYLGVGREKVHCSAEEMEHILTPELEVELTQLLHNPKLDPHRKPIPPKQQV